jgi:hypothetical protein
MGKKPPPDPPDPEDEKYREMEDWELEICTRRKTASSEDHKRAQKEIFRRMIEKIWLKKPK